MESIEILYDGVIAKTARKTDVESWIETKI